ncbi:casein kinase I-like [Teleopsis dalmanni]|uniref:casein kinase I-like n=1 Tax=Teleopsis dalmanni TaxID=139649 RepID=UPI0018CD5F5F|nr:casein kinase I-like [Teleopsis dalmanni]
MKLRICNKYELSEKIGSGSFGVVYMGKSKRGKEIAAKLEKRPNKFLSKLTLETAVYKALQGGVGIPRFIWSGVKRQYNCLAIELLGPSLEDLFNYCNRQFSMKTICLLAEQMVTRLEYMHEHHYIHRDIKPDNFVMGVGRRGNIVHIIDFGLAKKYRNPTTFQHISCTMNNHLVGTPRYVSINTHAGTQQSRRDDLESLGYVLIYFKKGSLPWQGLAAAHKRQWHERLAEKKLSVTLSKLCSGCPPAFRLYLNYCRCLRFEESPDHCYLRSLFRNLYRNFGYTYDNIFDWNIIRFDEHSNRKALNDSESELVNIDNAEKSMLSSRQQGQSHGNAVCAPGTDSIPNYVTPIITTTSADSVGDNALTAASCNFTNDRVVPAAMGFTDVMFATPIDASPMIAATTSFPSITVYAATVRNFYEGITMGPAEESVAGAVTELVELSNTPSNTLTVLRSQQTIGNENACEDDAMPTLLNDVASNFSDRTGVPDDHLMLQTGQSMISSDSFTH